MPNPNDMMMQVDPNAPKPWDDPSLRPPAPAPAPPPDTNPILAKLLSLIGMGGEQAAPPTQPMMPTDPIEIIKQQMAVRDAMSKYKDTGYPQ